MTLALREQTVVDKKGKPVSVLLDIRPYHKILKELEELETIRAYDAATASRDDVVPFDRAIAHERADVMLRLSGR